MLQLTSRVTILAVGVEHYKNLGPLEGPANDVENLRSLLVEDRDTALFKPSQFKSIINPTVVQLRHAINDYTMGRSADGDILIFYFSGHGSPIGSNDFGFCTVDTVWHPTEETMLPLSVVRFSDILQTLLIKNVTPVIIIDACYSGMAGRSLHIPSSMLITNMRGEVQKDNASNYALLCSCASNETSITTRWGGIFSHYLIEAARRGVPSQKETPFLTLQGIFPALRTLVESYTTGESIPRLHLGDTLPQFPFVRNTLFEPRRESFARYFIEIIKALWNKGQARELSPEEIRSLCGNGAYGNHNKLSYEPWGLVEDVPNAKKKRQLTDKGKAFAQGKVKIPKTIIRDPNTGNYVSDHNTKQVGILEFRTKRRKR
ncbi:MAG: caspase family protein [Chloroflexi bacterium]|nr:caspase family protein [Chloroflexota bacterium]